MDMDKKAPCFIPFSPTTVSCRFKGHWCFRNWAERSFPFLLTFLREGFSVFLCWYCLEHLFACEVPREATWAPCQQIPCVRAAGWALGAHTLQWGHPCWLESGIRALHCPKITKHFTIPAVRAMELYQGMNFYLTKDFNYFIVIAFEQKCLL